MRLGHGGGDMKELGRDAIERGIDALARMRRIADSHGAPLRAVATSAVREAVERRGVHRPGPAAPASTSR